MAEGDPEVIKGIFRAIGESRIDDLLASVDPDVVWKPRLRPGRSAYLGEAGTRSLVEDFHLTLGTFRMVVDDLTVLPDGATLVDGHTILTTTAGEVEGPPFKAMVRVHDGLVVSVDSLEPPAGSLHWDEGAR